MPDPVKRSDAADGGRQALLKATVRVVARLGMRGLTHRAVAQEAGVAHGLVTHHFGTREALITAAFREDARTRETAATLNPGTGEISDIGAVISTVVQNEAEEEVYQYEMILEALRRPELIDDVRQTYRSFMEALQRELDLIGADRTDALSRVVFAALDGLILQQLLFGDSADTDEAIERLHALLRADVAVSRMRQSLDGA